MTTEAFKIAGGLDLTTSTTKPVKQHRIASNFTTKITKSFLDTLYAFLDGLVHLASEESEYKRPTSHADAVGGPSINRNDLIDLSNPVCLSLLEIGT